MLEQFPNREIKCRIVISIVHSWKPCLLEPHKTIIWHISVCLITIYTFFSLHVHITIHQTRCQKSDFHWNFRLLKPNSGWIFWIRLPYLPYFIWINEMFWSVAIHMFTYNKQKEVHFLENVSPLHHLIEHN